MSGRREPGEPRSRTVGMKRRVQTLRSWPTVRKFLLVLLILYVAKQCLFVFAFRPFSGHDEVAHSAYLRTVATEGRVPVLPDLAAWRATAADERDQTVDLLPDDLWRYCHYVLFWTGCGDIRFRNDPVSAVTYLGEFFPTGYQYGANHPPLYYLLMTPLYWLSADWSPVAQQYLLRLAAIPFGIATVLFAYLLARRLFPGDAFLAITVPSFVAMQPQISYEAAMVNNDIVAIALYSAILVLVVIGLRDRFPTRTCLLLGTSLGLALLTKGTSITAAGVIGLAVLLGVGWRDWRGLIRRGVAVAVPALVMTLPWYLFLDQTYGNLDALPQLEALQAYWNRPAGTFWGMLASRDFVVMRFRETWGEFGWRLLPLSSTLLWIIAVPLVAGLGGLVVYAAAAGRGRFADGDDPVMRPCRWQWQSLAVLAVTCLVAYLAIIQFGTRFALTQARYLFHVVDAASLLLMLGLRTLIPVPLRSYAQDAIFAALVLLNLVIFTQYVIPHFLSA